MVTEELIHENDKPVVMRALLLRHRHVNEHSHGGFHFGSRRKFSSYTSLQVQIYFFFIFQYKHGGSFLYIPTHTHTLLV